MHPPSNLEKSLLLSSSEAPSGIRLDLVDRAIAELRRDNRDSDMVYRQAISCHYILLQLRRKRRYGSKSMPRTDYPGLVLPLVVG